MTTTASTTAARRAGTRAAGHRPAPRPRRATTAVVTGLGVTAPNGLGTEAYWRAALAGTSGLGRITRFDPTPYPSTVAGEISGYVDADHISSRLLPQTDRMTRLALTAADWALRDSAADLEQLPEYRMGVVTAASGGAVEFGQRELQNLWSQGRQYVSAYQSFAWFYAVNTGQISIRHKMRGASGVVLTEQAGGIDALGQARRQIGKGLRLVVAGGVDAALCPWGWVPQLATGLLSTEDRPDRAYLPFSSEASGYVPGEGGALLVVEEATAARERGAPRIYGELAGYAATLDPRPPGADDQEGAATPAGAPAGRPSAAPRPAARRPSGLRRAAENALADAGVEPADVDVVFADAAGVREADRTEALALAEVFGPRAVPVTAPKSMTGRLMAGGGALDVATALLTLRDGVIPPTANVSSAAPDLPIDLVTEARSGTEPRTALVLARGHGGFNSALVLRRHP